MAKKKMSAVDIVETHKPKNFKFKYIFKDDDFIEELVKSNYDIDQLDTIQNDQLISAVLNIEYSEKYSNIQIRKAKEPTVLDNGIVISKRMITKADKKLQAIMVGELILNDIKYIVVKFVYEKFDIIEVFILL